MRWICWVAALVAVCGLLSPAAAFGAGHAPGAPCVGCEHYQTLCAPACASQFLGWMPGCCECPPSPCDNAWAGYCEEKAKWKAFWYRMGTGAYGHHRAPVAYQPTPAIYQPTTQTTPAPPSEVDVPDELQGPVEPEQPSALPPVPEPVPETTTWRLNVPRWRW